jgi:hypothetical protein
VKNTTEIKFHTDKLYDFITSLISGERVWIGETVSHKLTLDMTEVDFVSVRQRLYDFINQRIT